MASAACLTLALPVGWAKITFTPLAFEDGGLATKNASRHTADYGTRRDVFQHHRTCSHDRVVTDGHAVTDKSVASNPNIITNVHRRKKIRLIKPAGLRVATY